MRTDGLRGRDYLTLLDFSREEVETILDVAFDLKRRFAMGEPHDHLLRAQTLFMIFYNQSLRTRNSFEAGMTQMGGHAHFLDPTIRGISGRLSGLIRLVAAKTTKSIGDPLLESNGSGCCLAFTRR